MLDYNKGIVIFTFDDILVDTAFSFYTFLETNFSFFNKYLDLYTLRKKEDIYKRNKIDLIDWLLRDNVKKLDKKNLVFSLSLIYKTIYEKYYNVDHYKNLPLTKLAATSLKNALFIENKGIQKIFILVKYTTNKDKEYKEQFIKTHFNSNKIELKFFKKNESYYSFFEQNNKWNLLVTDDIDLVEKISANDIFHKEFYMPKYGYDQASSYLKELIKQKNANIIYYDPFQNL